MPMGSSGYYYDHDITNHLGSIFYLPTFVAGVQETVGGALAAVMQYPIKTFEDQKIVEKVVEKVVRTLVDYVDSITAGSDLLVSRINEVFSRSYRELFDQDLSGSIPVRVKKVKALASIFDDYQYESVGSFYYSVHRDIAFIKRLKYFDYLKRVCKNTPCPAQDLLLVPLTHNSNYPFLDLAEVEKNLYLDFLKFKVDPEIFKQPKTLLRFFNGSSEAIGRKQFRFLQQIDLALSKWKKQRSVDYIHPGGSADI